LLDQRVERLVVDRSLDPSRDFAVGKPAYVDRDIGPDEFLHQPAAQQGSQDVVATDGRPDLDDLAANSTLAVLPTTPGARNRFVDERDEAAEIDQAALRIEAEAKAVRSTPRRRVVSLGGGASAADAGAA